MFTRTSFAPGSHLTRRFRSTAAATSQASPTHAARPRLGHPAAETLETRRLFAAFPVTTTADGGAGSLRQAIIDANAAAGPDTISVPAGTYTLTLAGADENAAATGDLDVTDDLTITGASAGTTIIQAGTTGGANGNGIDRVFHILDGAGGSTAVSMSGVTIRHGNVQFNGGGILHEGTGTLGITASTITSNRAGGIGGGGIRTLSGAVNLTDSTVSNNQASGTGSKSGGGIQSDSGELTLLRTTLSGNTADSDGGGIRIVFAAVTVTDSTISGNTSLGFDGGGIHADAGVVTITGSTISGNSAEDGGGILKSSGAVIVTNSTFSGNTATGLDSRGESSNGVGGGIEARGGSVSSSVSITDSTFSDNTAALSGGGINVNGAVAELTITGSTFSGNDATGASSNPGSGIGGAINNQSTTATLTNVTISGNTSKADGGGIHNAFFSLSTTTITNSTITDNTSDGDGGGIFNDSDGTVNLRNTLIAENNLEEEGTGPDVSGTFVSLGNNLIGIGDGSTGLVDGANDDQVGTSADPIDPLLGPLADNGGPTRTHALLPGSPAIDTANTEAAPATDQRGETRPQDGDGDGTPEADIGAFELEPQASEAPTLSINNVSKNEGNSGLTSFGFTVTRSGDTSGASTANYATSFGSANSNDLSPQSGQVTFAAGQTTRTITIQIKGDTQLEGDDTFFVNLSSPTGATIDDGQGRGTILNDDRAARGAIKGHVFDDRNLNQRREGSEPVLGGFTIYLDQNKNGRRDSGERSTTSDSAGLYSFGDLSAGNYVVRIVMKPGYRQTKPLPGGSHAVSLATGQIAIDRGFGATKRASISGAVFRDADRDGKLDGGEPGLSGRTVFIDANGNGKLDVSESRVVTDSRGRYTFASVVPGSVRLRLLLTGSTPTAPSNGVYHLTVADGSIVTGRNFGVR